MNISIRNRSLKEIDYINVVSFSGKSSGNRLSGLIGNPYSSLNKTVQHRFWFKLNRSIQYFSILKNVNRIYVVSEKFRPHELSK